MIKQRNLLIFTTVLILFTGIAFYLSKIVSAAGTAKLSICSGSCSVKKKGTTAYKPVAAGTPLAAGDAVKTGAKTKAEVKFPDGSVIRMADNTNVVIKNFSINDAAKTKSTSVNTNVGNVWAKIKKSNYKTDFKTKTPTAIAGVRSTVYRLVIDEDGSTTVKVYDGNVEVKTWLDAVNKTIQKGIKEKNPSENKKQIGGPKEVKGPKEISMEEWTKVVQKNQQIIIGLGKAPEDPSDFDPEADAKDPWVQWNKELDEQMDKEGE